MIKIMLFAFLPTLGSLIFRRLVGACFYNLGHSVANSCAQQLFGALGVFQNVVQQTGRGLIE